MEAKAIHKIIVVGIGPGSEDYIVPAARAAIENAAVLVGSSRALATFAKTGCVTCPITGDLKKAVSFIKEKLAENDVVVMVSGDPCYYSMLPYLRKNFSAEKLRVIAGISSMQLAFARLALPWQNAVVTSLHGRKPDAAELSFESGKMLGLLTDNVYTSRTIAEYLIELGWPKTSAAYILTRLSYSDERIIETTLEKAAGEDEITHCIMVVI